MRISKFRSISFMIILILGSASIAGSAPEVCTNTVQSANSVKMGIETYLGVSDIPGQRFISDGVWAGNGTFYPSITYMNFEGKSGQFARVSVGMGDLYTDSESTLKQPIEAYMQMPAGKAVVTVGKYWVPFAQQEWLYESKPGVMARLDGKKASLVASINYDVNYNRPKTYLRGGYKLAEDAELGLSLALGRGFCSDSVHDRGIALDTNIGFAGWRLYGEYNNFTTRAAGNSFKYLSGKLYYEKMEKLTPFVARFWWNDNSGTFGDFRSTVVGLNYKISPALCVEGAVSTTSDDPVSWLQFHWIREFTLF